MISSWPIELYAILGIDAHSSYCFICFLFVIVIVLYVWQLKEFLQKFASKNTRKDNHNTNTFSKHLLQSKYLLRWVCFFRYKMTYIYQRYSVNCIWKHIWITHFYINKPSARYLACHNMSFYIIHINVAFITQNGNVMSKSKSRYVQTKTQSI